MYCANCHSPNAETPTCVRCGVVLPTQAYGYAAPTVDVPLSRNEYILFTLAFLFVPFVNVIVSSVLYYTWRAKQPTRANQINRLGFIVLGVQVAMQVAIAVLVTP